jgi:hypothetical protein
MQFGAFGFRRGVGRWIRAGRIVSASSLEHQANVSLWCDTPHAERLTDKAEFFQPQA